MDVRCPHRKFAELAQPSRDEGIIRVMCPSRWCGRRPDVTVLHSFSTRTGALIDTRLYRTPKGVK